jgi:hypothetical protein
MTVGPIERFMLRIEQLEATLGRRPVVGRWHDRREGKVGPGGRWLLARLGTSHAEALDGQEEDALGEALAAEQRGDYGSAQQWVDLLARSHELRMQLKRGSSGVANAGGTGSDGGARD